MRLLIFSYLVFAYFSLKSMQNFPSAQDNLIYFEKEAMRIAEKVTKEEHVVLLSLIMKSPDNFTFATDALTSVIAMKPIDPSLVNSIQMELAKQPDDKESVVAYKLLEGMKTYQQIEEERKNVINSITIENSDSEQRIGIKKLRSGKKKKSSKSPKEKDKSPRSKLGQISHTVTPRKKMLSDTHVRTLAKKITKKDEQKTPKRSKSDRTTSKTRYKTNPESPTQD